MLEGTFRCGGWTGAGQRVGALTTKGSLPPVQGALRERSSRSPVFEQVQGKGLATGWFATTRCTTFSPSSRSCAKN